MIITGEHIAAKLNGINQYTWIGIQGTLNILKPSNGQLSNLTSADLSELTPSFLAPSVNHQRFFFLRLLFNWRLAVGVLSRPKLSVPFPHRCAIPGGLRRLVCTLSVGHVVTATRLLQYLQEGQNKNVRSLQEVIQTAQHLYVSFLLATHLQVEVQEDES